MSQVQCTVAKAGKCKDGNCPHFVKHSEQPIVTLQGNILCGTSSNCDGKQVRCEKVKEQPDVI